MTKANATTETVPAMEHLDEIRSRMAGRRLAICLDYDGTLSPIVRPAAGRGHERRDARRGRRLAARHTVAMVSGRDRQESGLVGLDKVYYAGSHGFDIKGPGGLEMQNEQGRGKAAGTGRGRGGPSKAAGGRRRCFRSRGSVSPWRSITATSPRRCRDGRAARRRGPQGPPVAAQGGGKKVFELRPDIDWDKGKAVLWLLKALDLDGPGVCPCTWATT